MTTKSEAAAAERKVMDRYEARLAKACACAGEYDSAWDDHQDGAFYGKEQLRILRASAAALFPGDQQRKHLLPALGKMVTAACRVIRRSAR